jgi:hypothetical protein
MRRAKFSIHKFHSANLLNLAAVVILLTFCFPARSMGQQAGQKTFSSPEEASKALFTAAQNNDEKALLDLFGPDGKEIVSSGDNAEDAESRANFVRRYQEMSRLVKEPDGSVCLYIGERNWPYPISLVNKGSFWYFDTPAGKKEILFRRVGRNEMSAIRICQELVAAQKEYYSQQKNEYAQKIFSDEGKHNGLYWKAADNAPQSPIGPLVARARGYAESQEGAPVPYRGYYFHILTRQGKNALGGAKSYLVNGKMTGGFAFVAYPAEHGSSGVMTFLVGEDGVVYEKNLAKKTETMAKSMKDYDPSSGWQKTEAEQKTAGGQPNK